MDVGNRPVKPRPRGSAGGDRGSPRGAAGAGEAAAPRRPPAGGREWAVAAAPPPGVRSLVGAGEGEKRGKKTPNQPEPKYRGCERAGKGGVCVQAADGGANAAGAAAPGPGSR